MKVKTVIYKTFIQKNKNYDAAIIYALSFLIPMVVFLLILKEHGFYPFGGKSMFIMDMRDQYMEFFASLRNVIHGDDSLFFSWSRSMGGNYLGLFAYYVASPLSFITLLFPVEKMTMAIVVLTVLKIGLAGFSFALFAVYVWKRTISDKPPVTVTKKRKTDKINEMAKDNHKLFLVLPLAVSYALISYNMVYSMCLMWLDGVILLPIILLGVEKILDGGKGLHYMFALAALFICNYYTGYMVGIFTALYTVYRILSRIRKEQIKEYTVKTLRFTLCTLLAFGISAPLIIPVVKDLMQGKLALDAYVPDVTTNFEFGKLFGKLQNGVYDSITNTGLPMIYCGFLVLLLILFFFVINRITIREKAGAVVILAFLAASFYFTKWDMAWHGFQYPTWFPYRYAFVCSFFMLYMALRALCAIASLKKVATGKAPTILIAAGVLSLIAAINLKSNGSAMFAGLDKEFGYSEVKDYKAFLDKTEPLVKQAKKEDGGFYRINQGYEFSKNDAMLLGYNGMTHYSSTFNAYINTLTPKLGIAQTHLWNSGYGAGPMLDSLFAVKYVLEDGIVPPNYTKKQSTEAGTTLYENTLALPIAYGALCNNLDPNLDSANPFENQNTLLNTITGAKDGYSTDSQYIDYFTDIPYTTEQPGTSWSYTFTAPSDNPIYLFMRPDSFSWADVYVNDTWIGNYFSSETTCNLYLGSFIKGQNVNVRVVPSQAITSTAVIAELHMDSLQQSIETLKKNGLDVAKQANGKLTGTIHLENGQKIITSIPYDAGWNVKVNGKKAKIEKLANTFMVIDVEEGSGRYTISMRYVSPGFGLGMLVFVIAVLTAALYFTPIRQKLKAGIIKQKRRSQIE